MNYQTPQPQREPLFDLRRLLMRWLISTLAVFVATWVVPGIEFSGPGWQLGVVAFILGLLSALLRPLLLLFSLPLILLTLGLFVLVINAVLLALTSAFAGQVGIDFQVAGFGAALLGGLVISVVSSILSLLAGEHNIHIRVYRGGREE